jgi:MraZ protein
VEILAQPVAPEVPRAFHKASVDEKGRLKLPSAFLQYLQRIGESQVFITTLDGLTGRIYPISVWRENENLFRNAGEDAQDAEDLSFIANAFGGDAEVDGQGRVLVPAELRRHLAIEGQQVHVVYYKGHFSIYTQAMYEQKFGRAMSGLAEKLSRFEQKGLR